MRPFAFLPEGRQFSCVAGDSGRLRFVIGRQESRPCDQILFNSANGLSSWCLVGSRTNALGQEFVRIEAAPAGP
jgi:hypothetical protein